MSSPVAYRVLVVDDEPAIRRAVELVLDGCEIVHAGSVGEAIEQLLNEGPFDIALVDKNLPDGSGLSLVPKVKELYPGVPVIIFTGYATLSSAIEAVEAGAFDYVVKPFDAFELSLKVRNAAEKRRLEAQLRRAERLEIIGRLAGGIAHDLNNLLTVFTTYTGFLREFLEEQPEDLDVTQPLDDAETLERACNSARSLTRQLLTFSGRQVTAAEPLSLNESVEQLKKTILRTMDGRIVIHTDLGADVPLIRIDVGQCEQLILNLVLNARDALKDGGTITLMTRRAGGPEPVAQLIVKDDGVGMSEETIGQIFDPFFTTKGAGRGTGLGLASVRRIAESLGGEVRVESALGVGSTFTIDFPGMSEAPALPRVSSLPSPPLLEGARILLAEDDGAVRESARRILHRAGYDVLCVADGGAAVAALEHAVPPRLVILDVVMPGPSMPELVRHIEERAPGVSLLLMSAHALDTIDERTLFVADMAYAFLPKPFTETALLRAVRAALVSG